MLAGRELYDKKDLFVKVSENNHAAFETLFALYKPRLHSYAFQLLKAHDDADEVVQEVFIRLWTKRDTLTSVDQPDQYIFTIVRNISLDKLRKIAADRRLRLDVWQRIQSLSNPTEEAIFAREGDELVTQAFGKLSPHKQTIFRLSRHEGLSHEQIAERLQISRNTVKNQLVSSLRFIREYLAHHFTAVILIMLRP